MILLEIKHRTINNLDWAFITFVLVFALIVSIKTSFEKRFNDFTKIIFTDKYLKMYKDSSNLLTPFTILVFLVNIFSFTLFIQLILIQYNLAQKTDWVIFIRIFSLLTVFILIKFLLEKIVATIFGIEDYIDEFNLSKVNYRTYIALLLLPVSIILFYNSYLLDLLAIPIAITLLILNIITYILSLIRFQKILNGYIFYFILYLCTFEIAPYYFIYYLIKKN